MTPRFIPGLELCKAFYLEAVRPILDRGFLGIAHCAARIGDGSEILGFDDEMSRDHHWGPCLLLFLEESDRQEWGARIDEELRSKLPYEFMGYPTNFTDPDAKDQGVQHLKAISSGKVNHRVTTTTLKEFFRRQIGFDIERELSPADWLSVSEQRLLSVTAGAVYHDDLGLEKTRSRLAYYPHDVWLYLMAADWNRISQEEHLMGRAGFVGDEVGSAVIAARLVRDIMHLCFLMERKYVPYPKWFGTAFGRLACAGDFKPSLTEAMAARTWQDRELNLAKAYELLGRKHNALALTAPMPEKVRHFHGRPFKVMAIHGFASSLLDQIHDEQVRKIATRPLIGSIDQFSDSTDFLDNPGSHDRLRRLYE